MVRRIGLTSSNTNIMAMLHLLFTCIVSCNSQQMNIQDCIIWRRTSIQHVSGQSNIDLKLGYYNPCDALFQNSTSVTGVDEILVETSAKCFKQDIVTTLSGITQSKYKGSRNEGVTFSIITALSA